MKTGSLTVVGTGIRFGGQITAEARSYIEVADKVLFLVADPMTAYWICELSSKPESSFEPESLHSFYKPGENRQVAYQGMVERTLSFVRKGLDVCLVSYGHPGVFAYPMHEAIRQARNEGYAAKMMPGISAEDCLFADLGVDPGAMGCQSFEATDFLIHRRKFDTSSSLILWQIGVVGVLSYKAANAVWDPKGLGILIEVLEEFYGPDHEVVIYEAAQYPLCAPNIERVSLAKVPESRIKPISTLYIPPREPAVPDTNMLEKLGISV